MMFNVTILLLLLFVPQITWFLAYVYFSLTILVLLLSGIGNGLIQSFVYDNASVGNEYKETFMKTVERIKGITIPMYLFAVTPPLLIFYQFYLTGFIVIASIGISMAILNLITNVTMKIYLK